MDDEYIKEQLAKLEKLKDQRRKASAKFYHKELTADEEVARIIDSRARSKAYYLKHRERILDKAAIRRQERQYIQELINEEKGKKTI